MRRSLRVACAVLVVVGLAACDDSGTKAELNGDSGRNTPSKVSVPVVKKDRDSSYRVGPRATVRNDGYSDGKRGTVTLQASTGTKHPDDNRHWLATRVMLKGGGFVRCEEYRATIWNDFGPFESVSMPCNRAVPLADVVRVEVVPFA